MRRDTVGCITLQWSGRASRAVHRSVRQRAPRGDPEQEDKRATDGCQRAKRNRGDQAAEGPVLPRRLTRRTGPLYAGSSPKTRGPGTPARLVGSRDPRRSLRGRVAFWRPGRSPSITASCRKSPSRRRTVPKGSGRCATTLTFPSVTAQDAGGSWAPVTTASSIDEWEGIGRFIGSS